MKKLTVDLSDVREGYVITREEKLKNALKKAGVFSKKLLYMNLEKECQVELQNPLFSKILDDKKFKKFYKNVLKYGTPEPDSDNISTAKTHREVFELPELDHLRLEECPTVIVYDGSKLKGNSGRHWFKDPANKLDSLVAIIEFTEIE